MIKANIIPNYKFNEQQKQQTHQQNQQQNYQFNNNIYYYGNETIKRKWNNQNSNWNSNNLIIEENINFKNKNFLLNRKRNREKFVKMESLQKKNQNNSENFLENFNNNNSNTLCLCKNNKLNINDNNLNSVIDKCNYRKNSSFICYQCNTIATATNSIHSTATTTTINTATLVKNNSYSLNNIQSSLTTTGTTTMSSTLSSTKSRTRRATSSSISSFLLQNIINSSCSSATSNSTTNSSYRYNSDSYKDSRLNGNDKFNILTQRTLLSYVKKMMKILCVCIFMNMLLCPIGVLGGYNELAIMDRNETRAKNGVCQSIDIRNKPERLSLLNDCRVVEGFVQIMLIENANSTDFDKYSFPLLTEITDYLMLFRIGSLKTLSKLFPNLMVIRGNKLFNNYAIVIYEMMDIQEIGLYSLTHIGRGGIRIEKNPMLCYVNTVNWKLIARHTTNDDSIIVITQNKKENECPTCSGKKEAGEKECSNPNTNTRLCWNRDNCQKVCPAACGDLACNDAGQCCNATCIGGCASDDRLLSDTSVCTICKDFRIEVSNNTFICSKTCPNGTFEHVGRRCLSETQCRELSTPLEILIQDRESKQPYIPFDGKCLMLKCPDGYYDTMDNGKRVCVACIGPCRKLCPSIKITNIGMAEKLRGCTHIEGALEIQIQSDFGMNMKEELESSLSSIVEIQGYLKIVRTYSLISLNFLRNLKVVTGSQLENKKYSLYVMDNQNLQDLFDEEHNITFLRGKYFFHFNPKLCFNKIERLRSMFGEKFETNEEDVSRSSNGNKIACNVTEINVTFELIRSVVAVIRWDPVLFDDERVLLGFTVYYIQAPYQNVTLYEVRNTCDNVGWSIIDETEFEYNKSTSHLLTHLEPYTQYALYVKAVTLVATESTQGAQSRIHYFTTKADQPDIVQKLKAYSNHSSEIMISWEPPKKPQGNLTDYVIRAKLISDSPDVLAQRNYCEEPLNTKDTSISETPTTVEKKPSEDKCNCENPLYKANSGSPSKKPTELDVEMQIDFENQLHNWVYVKRADSTSRRKREAFYNTTNGNSEFTANEFPKQNLTDSGNKAVVVDDEASVKENGIYKLFFTRLNASTTSFLLKDLKHYAMYSISIKACRDPSEGEGEYCSNEVIVHQTTKYIVSADDIYNLQVQDLSNQTSGSVRLSWTPPQNPNGFILTYTIKYQRVDIENSKSQPACITHFQFSNLSNTYTLDKLVTGNYSVQVMATSLAGDGRFTDRIYFYIEPKGQLSVFIIVAIVFIVLILLGVGVVWYVRRRYLPVRDLKIIASVNPEYLSMEYTPDEWEVPRDNITKIRELGQGSFGMVYEGRVHNLNKNIDDQPCAIKTVNENATDRERVNFLKEASVMKAFDTHHVVRLLGVVSCGQPTLVIMELMANGDLKGYLRSHRPDPEAVRAGQSPLQPPTLKRILQMAIEIADGMAYLSAKKFVHRDLAARNCMVADDLTVKIGDFGMTRDIYETDYYRKGTKGLLPVRWMAPESLKDGVFTSYSDIFSYGVVLWEMATLASQPYQGLSNDQVLRYVIDGGVMERPENCPDILYDMMRRCWQHRPSARPTFLDTVLLLLDDANPNFRNVSFYHSNEGQELFAQLSAASVLDDVTTPLRHEEALSLDVDPDDNYSYDRNDSHLVQEEDGPLPTIRSAHSPLRSGGMGSGIFTENNYIISSYHSGRSDGLNSHSKNGKNINSVTSNLTLSTSEHSDKYGGFGSRSLGGRGGAGDVRLALNAVGGDNYHSNNTRSTGGGGGGGGNSFSGSFGILRNTLFGSGSGNNIVGSGGGIGKHFNNTDYKKLTNNTTKSPPLGNGFVVPHQH